MYRKDQLPVLSACTLWTPRVSGRILTWSASSAETCYHCQAPSSYAYNLQYIHNPIFVIQYSHHYILRLTSRLFSYNGIICLFISIKSYVNSLLVQETAIETNRLAYYTFKDFVISILLYLYNALYCRYCRMHQESVLLSDGKVAPQQGANTIEYISWQWLGWGS